MQRLNVGLMTIALLFAGCSSSSGDNDDNVAPVDELPENTVVETLAPADSVQTRNRVQEVDELRLLDSRCVGGDDEACAEQFQRETALQTECDAGDDFSCRVLDTIEIAAGDLLCVAWDDLLVTEQSRDTFPAANDRAAEEETRFNGTEALRLASLDTIANELGDGATDAAGTAIRSLALLPLDLPDASADAAAQVDELASLLDVICAPPS